MKNYSERLHELKDELGWHEFDDEIVKQNQWILRKMMELIDIILEKENERN